MTTARCFFALALFLSFSAHAYHYKVFLLGGQSNMVGTGANTSGLPTALQSPQADVLFYYSSSLTTLRPGSGQDFGPEVTFGRTIADAYPSENFCLIKYAVSGSDLTNAWDPTTGTVYSNFRTKVADGLAALTAAGHTYEIVGMLWTQGERDARIGRTTAQYEFDLNEFIADLRTRYGANLRFFLNRLSVNQTDIPNITRVRAAQENVTSADPLAYLINADAMTFHDDLHFDAAGQIDLGEAFGQAYINAITPDVTAPEISALTPANAASPVDPWTNLTVAFDEEIVFETGKIYLKQTGGALVEEFDVASPPANLTLSVSSITIDPTNILAGSTGHYIEIDASAIDDLSGNSFAGITGDATWSFTTAASDLSPPSILSLSPTHLEAEVDSRIDLAITFTENITLDTGTITLLQSGGNEVESFDVANPPANLTLSGATITLNPSSDLSASTSYYVEIASTAIDDFSGNSFAGISGEGTWSFTVSDAVAIEGSGITASASSTFNPSATQPSKTIDGSGLTEDQHANGTQTGWYSEDTVAIAEQWIQWDLGNTYIIDSIQVWNWNQNTRINGSIQQVDIYISSLESPGDPEGTGAGNWTLWAENATFVKATGQNDYTGFDLETALGATLPTSQIRWVRFEIDSNFETAGSANENLVGLSEIRFVGSVSTGPDTTPPSISTLSPAHTASEVAPSSNLSITFTENIAFDTGKIYLRQTGGALVEEFDVANPPAGLTLLGASVTLNPTADLVASTGYYVEIDASAIDDLAGNSFAGISGNGTWSFTTTTPDTTAPSIDTLSPTNGAGDVPATSNLVITFTEDVAFDTGSIILKDASGSVIESFNVASPLAGLTLTNSTVTINPSSDLTASTSYYVEIDDTAIDDLAGNSFAGFSGNGTWSFTTAASSGSGAVTFGAGVTGTATDANSSNVTAYSGDVSGSDQLNGLTPTFDTKWFSSSGRTPANLVDGVHGDAGDVGSLAQPETPPAVVVFDLGTGDNGLGYDLTALTSIASWGGVGFGNQVWTLEVAGVGDDGSLTSTDFSTLVSADYTPLGNGAGSTKVTVTGISGTLTSGVQYVRITGEVNPDGNSGRFTWREFDLFGSSTVSANDYATWIDAFGLNPADQDLGDDPDGDGNDNGIENYFGTHPGEFSQGLVSGTVTGNEMIFTHPLSDSPASNLTATYRWSKDLSSFHDNGDPFEGTTVSFVQDPPSGGMVTVTATITGTTLDKLFVDIQVIEN